MLDEADFPFEKTAQLAVFIFGNAKSAKKGSSTLLIHGRDEAAATKIARAARNLSSVDVTHAGALDVKDVLRFTRLLFTATGYAELLRDVGAQRS